MDVLYLSHCVPNPPDKGERIRAYHAVRSLAREHRVHLAAFARNRDEEAGGDELRQWCESVHIERLDPRRALAKAALCFAAGKSLTVSYFDCPSLRDYASSLTTRVRFDATIAFTTAMAGYAPKNVPLFLDMADVDSEKWLQYGRMRFGGPLYTIEGRRLRQQELATASQARYTFLTTDAERSLLESFCQTAKTATVGNGVDFEYFDPALVQPLPELLGRKILVFVGSMDYHPNIDAVCWFAATIWPLLQRQVPDLEFFIVGRNPARKVRELHGRQGVKVTGGVPDVRPYLAAAETVVAPLRVARGIQNKVIEALAMGKRVLASAEVCRTFGWNLPAGLQPCVSADAYYRALSVKHHAPDIRAEMLERFQWQSQLRPLLALMTQAGVMA